MAKSPEEMAASMIANLEDKTGKTLSAWLKITKAKTFAKHGEIVKFLKGEHGVTHGYASRIAHETLAAGKPAARGDDLVEAQYAGAKADLKPIYAALIAAAEKLGADVEVAPKKSYVSLRRNKQFALIQPSTKTRVDLGLNLKGIDPAGKLEAAGSWNSMCSHRIRLEKKGDVNAAVKKWLKQAYAAS